MAEENKTNFKYEPKPRRTVGSVVANVLTVYFVILVVVGFGAIFIKLLMLMFGG